MLSLFDPHTIEVLGVLFELLYDDNSLGNIIRDQQVVLALTTTLYKNRIEQHCIAKANNNTRVGKDKACRTYVLYALAACIPGYGLLALSYQLSQYSNLFGDAETQHRRRIR